MPFKNTKGNLEKLERLLNEAGYVLRHEKGNFNSGYCLLEHRKVVVINKFLDQEGRISVLSDLLANLEIDINRLSADSKKCYGTVLKDAKKNEMLQQMVEQEIALDDQAKHEDNDEQEKDQS